MCTTILGLCTCLASYDQTVIMLEILKIKFISLCLFIHHLPALIQGKAHACYGQTIRLGIFKVSRGKYRGVTFCACG
jgi:hypothetical protein